MSPARPDAIPAVKPIKVSPADRLALARSNRLPHHDFLEMLMADEIARPDPKSAQLRAKAARLDPQMQLQIWDTPPR